jgi:hypothetical protein
MRVLIGIDDTDVKEGELSTARLARMFEEHLPAGAAFVGSLGHHLCSSVPGTTNNKASCIVLDCRKEISLGELCDRAVKHVERLAAPGSSPGIVVASDVSPALVELGKQTIWRRVIREEFAEELKDLPHAGLGEGWGLIGAAAAVGLTAFGWSGRWLEFGGLRPLAQRVQVSALAAHGIRVVSVDTDAAVPAPGDWVDTRDYLRPNHLGAEPVLLLSRTDKDAWVSVSVKIAEKKRRNYK